MRTGKNCLIFDGAKIGNSECLEMEDDVTIHDFVMLNAGKSTFIGRGSQINAGTVIAGGGVLNIGRYVTIGYNCTILSGTDTPLGKFMCDSKQASERHIVRGTIDIADRAFIGSNSLICVSRKNRIIRIGEGAVIGAGSRIFKDVEPNMIIIPKQEFLVKERQKPF